MPTCTAEEAELSDPSTCPEPTQPRTGDSNSEKMVLSDNEQDDALDTLTYIRAPTQDPLEIHGWDYSTTMENLATDQCSMWMNEEGAKVLTYRAYGGRLDNIEDLAKLRNDIKSALGTNMNPVVAVSVPKNGKNRKDTPPFCMLIKGITQEQAQELVTRVRATRPYHDEYSHPISPLVIHFYEGNHNTIHPIHTPTLLICDHPQGFYLPQRDRPTNRE